MELFRILSSCAPPEKNKLKITDERIGEIFRNTSPFSEE